MSSAWKQDVIGKFEAAAPFYEGSAGLQKQIAANLAALCPDLEIPEVLEIGCGTGGLTRHLLKCYRDGRFHITDISPAMIRRAQDDINNNDVSIEWEVMDGEQPDTARSYDLIVGNMAFQWFEDMPLALSTLSERLKPGGQILYSVPGPGSLREWQRVLFELGLSSGVLEFQRPPGIFKEDQRILSYESAYAFLKSLKEIGAHRPRRGYKPLGYRALMKACREFDRQKDQHVSWNILYGRLKR